MQTLGRNFILQFAFFCTMLFFSGWVLPVSANVTLTKFEPTIVSGKIQVNWITATETNNAGFNLYRSESSNVPTTAASKLNPNLIAPKGFGATGGNYTFSDTTAVAGKKYYYKLESLDSSGGKQYSDVKSVTLAAPTNTPQPTATKTNTPQATATKTNTLVPGAPTSTPAPTSTQTPIPTATNTLVPGAPTFTPAPPATPAPQVQPTAPRVAIAPKPGASNNPAPSVAPNAPAPSSQVEPTPINLAGAEPAAESVDEEEFQEDTVTAENTPFPVRNLAIIGMILTAGTVGFVGVLLFGLAAIFFLRAQSRR